MDSRKFGTQRNFMASREVERSGGSPELESNSLPLPSNFHLLA